MKKCIVVFVCAVLLLAGCSSTLTNDSTQERKTSMTDEIIPNLDTSTSEKRTDAEPNSSAGDEDWSEKYDRAIAMVYGDDFHMSYSMHDIVGETDDENFLGEYSKLDITVDNNCILLAQEVGDNTERTIKYDVDVISGECAIKYDNDKDESVTIWSGKGQADGVTTITLGGGANCLRIEALAAATRLKIKLNCTK